MQLLQILVRKPFCFQHLIRCVLGTDQSVLLPAVIKLRPFKQLKEAKLELVRSHLIDSLKRFAKTVHSFKGKTCDQIQMQVDILARFQHMHHMADAVQLRIPVYTAKSFRISRLHPDLHLNQAWPERGNEFKLIICHPVRLDLEMEIRDSVVMVPDVSPDLCCKHRIRIECPVHEFDLLHLLV